MREKFIVFGEPVGKGRPRFVRSTGRAYTPPKTAAYERMVREEYQKSCRSYWGDGTPLRVKITAAFGIPKAARKAVKDKMLAGEVRPTKKPDADNIVKIICDALNTAAWWDDTQVVEVIVSKVYSNEPMVMVEIEEVS